MKFIDKFEVLLIYTFNGRGVDIVSTLQNTLSNARNAITDFIQAQIVELYLIPIVIK